MREGSIKEKPHQGRASQNHLQPVGGKRMVSVDGTDRLRITHSVLNQYTFPTCRDIQPATLRVSERRSVAAWQESGSIKTGIGIYPIPLDQQIKLRSGLTRKCQFWSAWKQETDRVPDRKVSPGKAAVSTAGKEG